MARAKKRKRTSEVDGLVDDEDVRRMVAHLVTELGPLRRMTRSLTRNHASSPGPVTRSRSVTRVDLSSPAPKKRKVVVKPKKKKVAKPSEEEEETDEKEEEETHEEEEEETKEEKEEEVPEVVEEEEAPEEDDDEYKGKSLVDDHVDSETGDDDSSDDEVVAVVDNKTFKSGPGSGSAQHTVVIKHCTNRKYFIARANELQAGLEVTLPDIKVLVNTEKPPREPTFQVILVGNTEGPIVSLLNMNKPYNDLKDLDMEEVIATIKTRIQG